MKTGIAPVPRGSGNSFDNVGHYENFPVASLLCPPGLRPAVAAIYWFARTADDLADEGDATAATRLQDLATYRADLAACAEGASGSGRWADVFSPLQKIIVQYTLPVGLLNDLLNAFEQDVTQTRYADQAELLDYCQRSANPVGRLLLHLYRVNDDVSLGQSDAVCTALQLINFWQDLGTDVNRGRIYLPADAWAAHGVDEAQLISRSVNAQTTALVAANINWAKLLMMRGAPLARKVPGRAGWELRLVVQGGLRIAEKIEQINYSTLCTRPKINVWDTVVMAWRAILM